MSKVFDTWTHCQEAIRGIAGVRYQRVLSHSEGEAMLQGGIRLGSGLYAFTASRVGGIGVVVVWVADGENPEPEVLRMKSTSVEGVFQGSAFPRLASIGEVEAAVLRLRNVFLEVVAVHVAVRELAGLHGRRGRAATVFHRYSEIGPWMKEGSSLGPRDRVLKTVIAATRSIAERANLLLSFVQQGGAKAWVGGDDRVRFAERAGDLAECSGKGFPFRSSQI